MLKYAVKEDYESAKTEINLIPIVLEYNKPESKKKPRTAGASKKKKKGTEFKIKLTLLNKFIITFIITYK